MLSMLHRLLDAIRLPPAAHHGLNVLFLSYFIPEAVLNFIAAAAAVAAADRALGLPKSEVARAGVALAAAVACCEGGAGEWLGRKVEGLRFIFEAYIQPVFRR